MPAKLVFLPPFPPPPSPSLLPPSSLPSPSACPPALHSPHARSSPIFTTSTPMWAAVPGYYKHTVLCV
jgi:hypothetical protein